MKKYCIIYLVLLGSYLSMMAQTPNVINYQSVVRDANGQVLPNKNISVKVSLLQNSVTGDAVYSETFAPITNALGYITLQIGNGGPLIGNFSDIDWGTGSYFLKVDMDLDGGTDYSLSATNQLLTVPYAKYADVAGAIKNDKTVVLSPKQVSESLIDYLNAGYRHFVLQAGETYTFSNINLPSNTTILGNGAFVIPGSTSNKCFQLTDVTNITIRDVNFLGQSTKAAGSPLNAAHVAIHILRSQDVLINGCSFKNWLGAGIVLQGATTGISYYNYRSIISNNQFDQCFFGISIADRSEYGIFSNNILSSCRVGTWHSSGNWNIMGNTYVTCRAPYLSYAKTSPYGSLISDNWNHGSLVGNIMNHSNSGGNTPWGSASFPIGGVLSDPVGVVINGVLPPTFSSNTLYYTNLDFSGVAATSTNTPWKITGCVFSQMTITATSSGVIALTGCSKQANVTVNANVIE